MRRRAEAAAEAKCAVQQAQQEQVAEAITIARAEAAAAEVAAAREGHSPAGRSLSLGAIDMMQIALQGKSCNGSRRQSVNAAQSAAAAKVGPL